LPTLRLIRHCEERSDEAIHSFRATMDCFASFAMTARGAQRSRFAILRQYAMDAFDRLDDVR
jgi:hypothetical protein